MKIGVKEKHMSLKTRLNGKSSKNNSFQLKNEKGEVLAEVTLMECTGHTLEITTKKGLYIEKPSGFKSK